MINGSLLDNVVFSDWLSVSAVDFAFGYNKAIEVFVFVFVLIAQQCSTTAAATATGPIVHSNNCSIRLSIVTCQPT